MREQLKSFTAYDPGEGMKHVTCPILILLGENDHHVNVKSNMPEVGEAISAVSFTDIRIKIIPLADHGYSAPGSIEKGQMITLNETQTNGNAKGRRSNTGSFVAISLIAEKAKY